jgi:hypothetical protein
MKKDCQIKEERTKVETLTLTISELVSDSYLKLGNLKKVNKAFDDGVILAMITSSNPEAVEPLLVLFKGIKEQYETPYEKLGLCIGYLSFINNGRHPKNEFQVRERVNLHTSIPKDCLEFNREIERGV